MSRDSRFQESLIGACCALLLALPNLSSAADKAGTPKGALPNRAPAATMTTMEAPDSKIAAAPDSTFAAMLRFGTPGEQHAWLAAGEGTWKAKVQQWAASGEPILSEGTSTHKMTLGGRFLEQRFLSTMFGQPFEGYGLTGYDNQKHEFQSFWIDNASTGMAVMTGTLDETGKVLTLEGTMSGPDGKPMIMRSVTQIMDGKTQVFSMYGLVGPKEQLMMEITYTKL